MTEKERLKNLESYAIIDTNPEAIYDDITRIASYICATPIALISFITHDRQWFKSKTGTNISETPRNISICQHTILQRELLIVEDAINDSRFNQNPLVIHEPKIRFYAGAPLVSAEGFALGTLCVIDLKPNRLGSDQKEALQALSRQVISQLSLHRINLEMEQKNLELSQQNQLIKEQQEQMIQSGKLALIGEMSGGIAHEINTPLSVIDINIRQIERKLKSSESLGLDSIQTNINMMHKTIKRISNIVSGLRKFARQTSNDLFEVYYVKDIVKDSVELTYTSLKNVHFETRIDYESMQKLTIECRSCEIAQILVNLLQNAAHAIKDLELDRKWIGIKAEKSESTIEIWVSNPGSAIPLDLRNKIFQPFFTTKPVGEGTGLGLSISLGIAKSHHGELRYEFDESGIINFVLTVPKIQPIDLNHSPKGKIDAQSA